MNQFYVTTSIPYVNDVPHLGHALEFLIADVYARRARKQNKQVIFSTGTDEHGGKIDEKAEVQGISAQELADNISKEFQGLTKLLNISNNRFVRTTDPAHIKRAQLIWQKLQKDIYKGSYIGWYCTGDEAYFSETEVRANNGVCPNHNRPFEKIEEENYFFKLSKYSEDVYSAIKNNKFKIYPKTRRNEILALFDKGLEDISISRPKQKIKWGIDVPGDPSQVMYVWFEALMNYITVLGYPEHPDFKQFWPANIQIVGKDIIRFHAAIWPAMLLSLGLELPENLYAHGFIEVDNKKMSKSLKNVIAPKEIIDKHGVDAYRYYFLRHIPSSSDGNFTWDNFEEVYNSELANELGNLVQRTASMIQKYLDYNVPEQIPPEHDINNYETALDEFRIDQAIEEVWKQVRGLNQYIEETKPWAIYKENDPDHLREIFSYLVSSILEIADLLEPFMPETSDKITKLFCGSKIPKEIEILFLKTK